MSQFESQKINLSLRTEADLTLYTNQMCLSKHTDPASIVDFPL